MIPVIMAGGSGTRLWPLSRTAFPKQFLALTDELTLLQMTLKRLEGLTQKKPMVITNEQHRFLVAEQVRVLNKSADILLEPEGRNTAPAIALAAFFAMAQADSEPPTLLVLAADHQITDDPAFQQAVQRLRPSVEAGCFGTLGVVPTEPATGYGYIKTSSQAQEVSGVECFFEKPDQQTAQRYIDSGDYLWNSGMFMVRADRYLEELERFQPEIYRACKEAMQDQKPDMDFIRVDQAAFLRSPDISIDYAVMEPLCSEAGESKVVVTPLNAGWSDVGSWSSLWEISEKDEQANVSLGQCQPILKATKNSLIHTSDRLVTTLGVQDLVIVDTQDALLVAHKDHVQDVKSIVNEVKQRGGTENEQHRVVYRPWGKYDLLDMGERYQVKSITVNPSAKLSVQMHHHRAEHWVVVSGTANVTIDGETFMVTENQSTYIPIGAVHALENPGKVPLEMIEVQSGSYLGEDDIIRFEDRYGRS